MGRNGNGHLCPECGTPRGADNTPSCGCGRRASEALRDARTAEAAAAEDFDPLRIRPYVELEADGDSADAGTGPVAGPRSDETMPLRPIPPSTPSARDLSLFLPDTAEDDAGDTPPDRTTRHRRTRTVLLGTGGALVAVIAAAGLASGLFTYEAPSRDTALPDDVRASVPAPSTSEASEPPAPAVTATRSAPVPASPPPAESASPSPSPSRSSTSPTPSPSTEPTTAAPSTAEAAGSQEVSAAARDPEPPTLRRGDKGPEVTELELRLTQLGLYTREARGSYNEGVEDAVSRYQWARGVQPEEYGVYDLSTRERLESETTEP
ncbi:peptidoglycan-binding protein [Streptomyces viridochromogenes]|uniref:Peptidoglycan-binding protein n=1 Tax=Streptomyces viridochromogenes TaxID=1938 RepID=A0A0J8C6P4_STRVR|nr:peptidoglycan-binding protein [Streptomyces viridochromogenes]KOG20819.1 peptidoglycan-binding protein [Streptomyces viridochromogenes]